MNEIKAKPVPRTVSLLRRGDEDPDKQAPLSQPISAFANERAYVLLGDPGSGKTTEFKQAATAKGGVFVPASRFVRQAARKPEWRQKTLFIDGLDEIRAGEGDPRTPLDAILAGLEELDRPRVRISCRQAAWRAGNDDAEFQWLPGYEQLLLLHLDPLGEAAAKQLLAHHGVRNADKFLLEADDRGLLGLLDHPLALDLLAKVFATDGCWPDSKLETFEKACRKLAEEHNKQHRAARRVPAGLDDTISAAGVLATFFLVGGKEHIEPVSASDADADASLRLEDIPGKAVPREDRNTLTDALGTKLFSSADGLGFLVAALAPYHRSVAEYLAAKHLHERIEEGVPAGRVLALLAGADGIVVPSLRGLAAWLATFNPDVRRRLVDEIPLDLLTGGDPTRFPLDHQQQLLRALAQLPSHRQFKLYRSSPAVRAALTGPETMELLRTCIAENDPEAQHQLFVEFLFDGLASASSPHRLFSVREAVAVARDDRWIFAARKQALHVALRIAEHDHEGIGLLQDMLKDLNTGDVADANHDLRGTLVRGLYPRHLQPSQILGFLPRIVGGILQWHLSRTLAVKTDDAHVPDVLDALSMVDRDQTGVDYPRPFGGILEETFVQLLDRGLQLHGETVAVGRLYDWLSLHPETQRVRVASSPVAPWLSAHPEIRRALLREHVRREGEDARKGVRGGDRQARFHMIGLLFLGLSSAEAVDLCLDEAVAAAATASDDAPRYLYLAGALNPDRREWASSRLRSNPELVEHLERMAEQTAKMRQAFASREAPHRERARRSPELIWEVGAAYLGIRPMEPSVQPLERLHKWFAEDANDGADTSEAVDAALRALRQFLHDTTLPSLAELLELDRRSKMSRFAYPVLAGLDHVGRREDAIPGTFGDDWIRSALGLHYLTIVVDKGMPRWVGVLLDAKPGLVADVLVEVLAAQIRHQGRYEEHHLIVLDTRGHADLLEGVLPKLLNAFPIRGTKRHLAKLRAIVEIALHNLPRDQLREIVERKLSFGSMDTAQRAVWLGVGVRAWPRHFVGRALDFLADKRDITVRHLTDAWATDGWPSAGGRAQFSLRSAGIGGAFLLVRAFGRRFAPEWRSPRSIAEHKAGRAIIVSEEEQTHNRASKLVRRCIRYLSGEPRRSASRALQLLVKDPALASWRNQLEQASEEQAELRREAAHRHPSPADIGNVLTSGPPTNAGDLAEVVVEKLQRLRGEIRDGNANDWRLFWNEDGRGRPTERKPENSCRDALLGALRWRLERLSIDVQPESSYAEGKRADIRASAPGGNPAIPIEVKMGHSSDLWSAPQEQLIKKYTRDPASGGHGIYLVLWFGECWVPPSGTSPKCPKELEDQLREQLSPDQRPLVRMIVIDVERPQRGLVR